MSSTVNTVQLTAESDVNRHRAVPATVTPTDRDQSAFDLIDSMDWHAS